MEADKKSYSRPKGMLVTSIVSSILLLLLIISGVYFTMMSVILFYIPGST